MNFHQPAWSTHGDFALVRTEISRENGVVFVTHGCDFFGGDDVPQRHTSGLAALATTHDQDLAVLAELHVGGLALGEWNHSSEIECVEVEQQHLPLARHRHQRRPRTHGQSDGHAGHSRVNQWIEKGMFRHRRRSIGFSGIGNLQRQIDRRFGRRERLAPAGLEQTAANPLLEDVDFLVGNLGLVRRHVGLLRMSDGAIEFAGLRIPRHHHGAGAASFHQATVGGQIEIALLLVGIVALAAIVLDDRQQMILIGDLFLRDGWNGGQNSQRPAEDPAKNQPG